MTYAVIDTNVIVSAMMTHNPQSATTKIVQHLANKVIVPLYNEEILQEYDDVLHRPKLHIRPELAESFIAFIKSYGIEANRVKYIDEMPDEDDRVFYEISLSKEESFLVTGNLKHYPITPKVVTPAQMLEILNLKSK